MSGIEVAANSPGYSYSFVWPNEKSPDFVNVCECQPAAVPPVPEQLRQRVVQVQALHRGVAAPGVLDDLQAA